MNSRILSIKLITFIFLLTKTVTAFSAANCGGADGCFILSDGEIYREPFNVQAAQEITIFGESDVEAINAKVGPFGYKAIQVGGSQGPALMALDIVHYEKTDVGPYNEFIVMYPVQRLNNNIQVNGIYDFILLKSPKLNATPNQPQIFYYMDRLILGGNDPAAIRKAVLSGREVYGFPKEEGYVAMDPENPQQEFKKHIVVQSQSGDLFFRADLSHPFGDHTPSFAAPSDLYQLTTGLGSLIITKAARESKIEAPLPLTLSGSVAFSQSLAGSGNNLGFTPKVWVYSPSVHFSFATFQK